jgi:hypothetical protein
LIVEGVLQREWREEGSYGGDEEFELGGVGGAGSLMRDVVEDQILDVFHDLCVAAMGVDGHGGHVGTRGLMDSCWLGEQDEGDGEEALHPFDLWCCL